MYELIQLTEHDYYVDCPAKIGLVRTGEQEAVAIDSGSDKDAGKKVLRILEAQGWKLTAILNTHSHADHIGGNRFLQDRTGCRVFANGLEAAFTNFPVLEPVGLYGGYPMKDLRHKFLLAQESRAEQLTEAALPAGMRLLNLPGHSFDMAGFLTADGTAYIGDCVSSEETLEKYGIGYLWDVEASLNTLNAVKSIAAKRFVPAHAPVSNSVAELAERNAAAIREAGERILSCCAGATFETILQRVFAEYGLNMNAQQYALIGSTVRSYLSWLHGQGKVGFVFEDNRMLWKTIE